MRFIVAMALCAITSGQDFAFLRQPPSHVSVSTSVSAPAAPISAVKSHRSVRLIADVTPKPNIHVYAPGAEGYQAITVTIEPRPGIASGEMRYPKSEMLVTGAERVPVFSKPFQLSLPITIDRTIAGAGPLVLAGSVHLQACDDQVCYKPETVAVSWEIRN